MEQKSSFLTRTLSKQDAIIQLFRPQLAGRVTQALDILERIVTEAETLTINGTVLKVAGSQFNVTPDDLRANLDEFGELEKLAKDGRAFLTNLGYVSPRKTSPILGNAPVGKVVDVQPISVQLPGSEPMEGVTISPKVK